MRRLRRDPSLITLLDFESGAYPGKHSMVQGRWPKSLAPSFVRLASI